MFWLWDTANEHNRINGENVTFKYRSGLFYLRYFISINGITCTLNFNCNHTGLKAEYKRRPDLTQLWMWLNTTIYLTEFNCRFDRM